MQSDRNWLAEELAKDCRTVEDIQEKLKHLFKDTIQQVFEAEIDTHLGNQNMIMKGIIRETAATATVPKR